VAILEGFESQDALEEKFESKNGMGLEYEALERWFNKAAQKHSHIFRY